MTKNQSKKSDGEPIEEINTATEHKMKEGCTCSCSCVACEYCESKDK